MRFGRLLIALVLIAGATLAVATEGDFADAWILVRLNAPLTDKRADGSFRTVTGRVRLDSALREAKAERIVLALRASTEDAADAARHARYGLDRIYRVVVPAGSDIEELVRSFESLPDVEYAEPDYIGRAGGALFPNDPLFSEQYGFDQFNDIDVDGPEAWGLETGKPMVIAVLDTGIDSDHTDLDDHIVPGYDFVNEDADPEDDHGHGTNVASIAAAEGNNARWLTGACWNCKIMPLKVLDANNFGFFSDWADAIVWATDHGARILNLSAGGFSSSATLFDAVRYAYDAGVVHVSITHNQDTSSITYPGRYAETIAVGATERNDFRASPFCYSATSGSNWGPQIDVVAPGEQILGASTTGNFSYWCGTSQAAPLVAGLVGLMHSLNPSVGREEVRHLIRSGAEDEVGRSHEDVPGFDLYHGWGRVNMDRTLRATRASSSLRVDGQAATRLSHVVRNPVATSWDFIRGDLGDYNESAAGVELGVVTCVESGSPDPNTDGAEDTDTPAAGQGFYYLSRFHAAPGAGSLGASSRNRDRWFSACAE